MPLLGQGNLFIQARVSLSPREASCVSCRKFFPGAANDPGKVFLCPCLGRTPPSTNCFSPRLGPLPLPNTQKEKSRFSSPLELDLLQDDFFPFSGGYYPSDPFPFMGPRPRPTPHPTGFCKEQVVISPPPCVGAVAVKDHPFPRRAFCCSPASSRGPSTFFFSSRNPGLGCFFARLPFDKTDSVVFGSIPVRGVLSL